MSELDPTELMAEAEKEAAGKPPRRARGAKNVHGLTEMEEMFCAHYLKTKDEVAALKAAGYSIPGPSFLKWRIKKLMDKPAIALRLKEIQDLASVDVAMTREIFHQKLLMVYQKALEESSFKDANGAMEILGKSLGYFIDQKQTLNINANMDGVSSAERRDKLMKLAKTVGLTLG